MFRGTTRVTAGRTRCGTMQRGSSRCPSCTVPTLTAAARAADRVRSADRYTSTRTSSPLDTLVFYRVIFLFTCSELVVQQWVSTGVYIFFEKEVYISLSLVRGGMSFLLISFPFFFLCLLAFALIWYGLPWHGCSTQSGQLQFHLYGSTRKKIK